MGKENMVSLEECKLKQPEVTLVPQIVKILKLRMCQALQQALGRAGEVVKVLPLLTMGEGRLLQIKYSYIFDSQQS